MQKQANEDSERQKVRAKDLEAATQDLSAWYWRLVRLLMGVEGKSVAQRWGVSNGSLAEETRPECEIWMGQRKAETREWTRVRRMSGGGGGEANENGRARH